MIKNQLESEKFPVLEEGNRNGFKNAQNNWQNKAAWRKKEEVPTSRKWTDLSDQEQKHLLHQRLGEYSRKVYGHSHDTQIEERESIVCQRENSFYVDTVRKFRDRRYEYKNSLKTWRRECDRRADDEVGLLEAKKMMVIMDSLQLAHKCILNSFYGYVMRKGSRWYSMEMAGTQSS